MTNVHHDTLNTSLRANMPPPEHLDTEGPIALRNAQRTPALASPIPDFTLRVMKPHIAREDAPPICAYPGIKRVPLTSGS